MCKKYTGFNFMVDAVCTLATSGLWLGWVVIRESRNGIAR